MRWTFALFFVSLIQLIRADGCNNATKPDFSALEGRISEKKCQEYNWERRQLEKCFKDAANTEFPYMGFLGYKKDEKYRFLCGAFLVSPKFALTAKHCIMVLIPNKLWVPEIIRFGNNNLDDNEQHVDCEVRRTHPFFVSRYDGPEYDMGLVELRYEVPFTKSIYPGCLWTQETLDGVENIFSPGWPKAETDNKNKNVISELKIHIIEPSLCHMLVKERFRLLDTQICGNQSIASIPSYDEVAPTGGSVMVKQFNLEGKAEDRMPFVLGVASFGVRAVLDEPEEFENVGFYLQVYNEKFLYWMEQIIWEDDLKKERELRKAIKSAQLTSHQPENI